MRAGLAIAAVASSVVFAAAAASLLVHPPRRLGPRIRPYTAVTRVGLGLSPDVLGRANPGPLFGQATLRRLWAPMLAGPLDRLARMLLFVNEEQLELRLRQSGLYPSVEEELRPQAYRIGALFRAAVLAAGAAGLALVTGGSGVRVLLFGLVGAALGMFLARSRLSEAVRRRRDSIRAELYTVNQLVAMYTRVGGGALEALRYVAERAHGTAVEEISEVLLLHERGWSLGEALERAGGLTPEPEAARTYRLLSTCQEQGADLSEALLGLSKDLRSVRRDDMRRQAAKRRILMVIPVVVILAPVTMLFLAAPIPSIVFGG